MPRPFGIAGSGGGRECGVAAFAVHGDERRDRRHALGRQEFLEVGRMSGLPSGPALGLLLADRGRGLGRVGRGRQGGIGGVGAEAGLEAADADNEFRDLALQVGDDRVAVTAPKAERLGHPEKIARTAEWQDEHPSTG